MAFTPPKATKDVQSLLQIMQNLRDPDGGCPWDVEQTHASIAQYAIEEAYEVVDAIENGTNASLKEELGDMLLQVVFHATLAEERGAFDFGDVVDAIIAKMVRRHPHVFEASDGRSADAQTQAWEDIKAAERAAKSTGNVSLLDDVPIGFPALTRAEKLGKRAARAGFDWPDTQGVIAKIREELQEVEDAIEEKNEEHIKEELGDLLFSVANLTRYLNIDGESALRACNEKFAYRFRAIEEGVAQSGKAFRNHTLAELEIFWEAAKDQ
ncbi:MAG: nucleoside triphosphate pyrophosphohydrolase [Pseudomonadota bacterium]